MDRVTREIIPAGDSGSFTIPESALLEMGAESLRAFEALVLAEARVRGLEVSTQEDFPNRGILVRWRPDRNRG